MSNNKWSSHLAGPNIACGPTMPLAVKQSWLVALVILQVCWIPVRSGAVAVAYSENASKVGGKLYASVGIVTKKA